MFIQIVPGINCYCHIKLVWSLKCDIFFSIVLFKMHWIFVAALLPIFLGLSANHTNTHANAHPSIFPSKPWQGRMFFDSQTFRFWSLLCYIYTLQAWGTSVIAAFLRSWYYLHFFHVCSMSSNRIDSVRYLPHNCTLIILCKSVIVY